MKSYIILFWVLAGLGLVLDQATKYGIFAHLNNDGSGGEITVVEGCFKIEASYAYPPQRWETTGRWTDDLRTWSSDYRPRVNEGALFGIGQGSNWLFAVVSLAAVVLIVFFSRRSAIYRDPFLCLALGLILAGTLGNLYDRLVFGGVRDFVHWGVFIWDADKKKYFFDWPVFNIADCCLVVGAGTLLVHAFFVSDPAAAQTPVTKEQESAVVH